MAVVVKYVVERNGKEVMTFADKKEADAYDRQLDIAEGLQDYLADSGVELPADQLDELTLFMAKNRDAMIRLLKGQAPVAAKGAAGRGEDPENTEASESKDRPTVEGGTAGKPKRGRPKAVAA